MAKIDLETATNIRRILMLCRSRGTDPVATLDLAGLLRHPDTIRADLVAGADLVIASVMATPVQMIKHSDVPKTPLDLHDFIIKLLESIKKGIEDGKAAQ